MEELGKENINRRKQRRDIKLLNKKEIRGKKFREIDSYIGGRKCTQTWKFINST